MAIVMESVESAVEVKSNAGAVLSLTALDKMRTNTKGRPCVHGFAGRIALLREEVEWALKNGDVFIEMMQKTHRLTEQRRADLVAAGIIDTSVTEMFYTYQGPIGMVLSELQSVQDKYQEGVEAGTVSIRYDFHKQKTMNDPMRKKKPTAEEVALYVAPVIERRGFDDVCLQIEAFDDRVYGYARVTMTNEPTFE